MLLRLLDAPQGVWQGTKAGTGVGGQHHQHSHNPGLSVLAQSSHGDPGILTHTHARAHKPGLPCPVLLGRWKQKTNQEDSVCWELRPDTELSVLPVGKDTDMAPGSPGEPWDLSSISPGAWGIRSTLPLNVRHAWSWGLSSPVTPFTVPDHAPPAPKSLPTSSPRPTSSWQVLFPQTGGSRALMMTIQLHVSCPQEAPVPLERCHP